MSSTSSQEKGKLASELIKQAPPGEFREVLSDVRTLLNDDSVLREGCLQAITEYNESVFTPCKVGKGSGSLVTSHAKSGADYVDNRHGLTFTFDQVKREATGHTSFSHSSNQNFWEVNHPLIDTELQSYLKDHYKTGNSAIYLVGGGSGDDFAQDSQAEIIICIEAHLYSPDNFWNGHLLNEYQISAKNHTCKGLIKAQVHYYEDGNVQLLSTKNVDTKLKAFNTPQELAENIRAAISTQETNFQESIVEEINKIMETTFKALRRQLPITRSKIEWSKIAAYGLGSQITK